MGANPHRGTTGTSGPEPVTIPRPERKAQRYQRHALNRDRDVRDLLRVRRHVLCRDARHPAPTSTAGSAPTRAGSSPLPGHVYPEVESVIRQVDGYVVVEKFGAGAEVAEAIDSTTDDGRT